MSYSSSLLFAPVLAFFLCICCSVQCQVIPGNLRFDCHPEPGATQTNCESRGCLWASTTIQNAPYCYYPSDWGYVKQSHTAKPYGDEYILTQGKYKNPYGSDITSVKLDIIYDTNERLRLRYVDMNDDTRYTVPIHLPEIPSQRASNPMYSVVEDSTNGIFGFNISQTISDIDQPRGGSARIPGAIASQSQAILTTALPGFAYADQFLQIVFGFVSRMHAYGWGERYSDLHIPFNFTTYPSFSRDIGDADSFRNSYGVHPFLLAILSDSGDSFGVFIANSNAMEAVFTPFPALQYRTIGGILDVFVFFGPTPAAVIAEYWKLIGSPFLPPLWSLGFHLCRWGYNSLNRTRHILQGMRANRIPYDTQWNDIDYMDAYKDFTYDHGSYAGLPAFVSDEVHDTYHMRYVHIIDPGIANDQSYAAYTDGLASDAFIRDLDGHVVLGRVWPGTTAFPDFWNESTKAWWGRQSVQWTESVHSDGWWIDMNEVSNFVDGQSNDGGCPKGNTYEYPPYFPHSLDSNTLFQKTICMTSQQSYGDSHTMHYNVHSLFGMSEMIATQYALNVTHGSTLRNFIISRSTYAGAGQYGGHWLGDNSAHYLDMELAISGVIAFNLYGIPMVGTDICGFGGDTTVELCARWMAVGAFYPFSRNHNTNGATPQDPPSLGEPVISISRKYLRVRYQLLPYLYSLFYHSHVDHAPVVRALWFEWPGSAQCAACIGIDQQFLFGAALLISPALTQGQTSVRAYFPGASERWFEWFSYLEVQNTDAWTTVPAPLDVLPIHIRGGSILPLQVLSGGELTTAEQSPLPYQLLVAFDSAWTANGDLYMDDGVSIDSIHAQAYNYITFAMVQGDGNAFTLANTVVTNGYTAMPNKALLNELTVIGFRDSVTAVINLDITQNGQKVNGFQTAFNRTSASLIVSQLVLYVTQPFQVTFEIQT